MIRKGVVLGMCILIILISAGNIRHTSPLQKVGERVLPTVSIEYPYNGDILNDTSNPTVTINVYYNAGSIGQVTDVWIYIDGIQVDHEYPNQNSGNIYYDWNYSGYAEGQHIIRAEVETLAGETNQTSIYVYVNLLHPYGYISPPSNNSIITGNSVAFTVTAIDNGSGIYSINYYMDNILLHTENLSWSDDDPGSDGYQTYISKTYYLNSTKYSDGVHHLFAIIYDNSGNIYSQQQGWSYTTLTKDIIIDNNPPSVNITQPDANSFVRGTITISVDAKDNGSGIDYVEFYIDGSKVYTDSTSPYSYSWDTTNYGNGNHQIKVIAYDKAGFSNDDSIYVYADNEAPIVTISSPSQNSLLNTSSVDVKWSGSDSNSGIDHYEIRVDDGNWINRGVNTSYTFTSLQDGSHTVDVKAVDKAGNEATDSVTFTVDTTKPTLSIMSPTNNSAFNTSNIIVKWSGTDATSGIDHYEIKFDNGNWINVGVSTSYIFTNISDGTHTVKIKAIDKAGNFLLNFVNFIIDTTAPSISINFPSNNMITNTSTITVKWIGADVTSGINRYEIKIDNGNWINVDTNTSYTFTGLSDGKHIIIVKAIDNTGNTKTATITFMVDTEPPIIKINSPKNNTVLSSNMVTISWSGTDVGAGINYYEIKIDGGSWIKVGVDTSYQARLSPGKHTITLKAIDKAGNTAIVEITILIKNSSTLISGWTSPLIGAIAAISIAGIIFALWKRRQKNR